MAKIRTFSPRSLRVSPRCSPSNARQLPPRWTQCSAVSWARFSDLVYCGSKSSSPFGLEGPSSSRDCGQARAPNLFQPSLASNSHGCWSKGGCTKLTSHNPSLSTVATDCLPSVFRATEATRPLSYADALLQGCSWSFQLQFDLLGPWIWLQTVSRIQQHSARWF